MVFQAFFVEREYSDKKIYTFKTIPKPKLVLGKNKIDSSTIIDGNVEFVHSQYSCIPTSQVSNKTRKTTFSPISRHVFQKL